MTTLEQWKRNPELALRLTQILQDPVMKSALEVLLLSQVSTPVLPQEGVSLLEYGAIMNARRDGYASFYRDLTEGLLRPAAERAKESPKPWGGSHVHPNNTQEENETRP